MYEAEIHVRQLDVSLAKPYQTQESGEWGLGMWKEGGQACGMMHSPTKGSWLQGLWKHSRELEDL